MRQRSYDPFIQFAIETVALIDAVSIDNSEILAKGIEDEHNDIPVKKSLIKKLRFQAANIRRFFPQDDIKRCEVAKARLLSTHRIMDKPLGYQFTAVRSDRKSS